jgi:hypothetical protein
MNLVWLKVNNPPSFNIMFSKFKKVVTMRCCTVYNYRFLFHHGQSRKMENEKNENTNPNTNAHNIIQLSVLATFYASNYLHLSHIRILAARHGHA